MLLFKAFFSHKKPEQHNRFRPFPGPYSVSDIHSTSELERFYESDSSASYFSLLGESNGVASKSLQALSLHSTSCVQSPQSLDVNYSGNPFSDTQSQTKKVADWFEQQSILERSKDLDRLSNKSSPASFLISNLSSSLASADVIAGCKADNLDNKLANSLRTTFRNSESNIPQLWIDKYQPPTKILANILEQEYLDGNASTMVVEKPGSSTSWPINNHGDEKSVVNQTEKSCKAQSMQMAKRPLSSGQKQFRKLFKSSKNVTVEHKQLNKSPKSVSTTNLKTFAHSVFDHCQTKITAVRVKFFCKSNSDKVHVLKVPNDLSTVEFSGEIQHLKENRNASALLLKKESSTFSSCKRIPLQRETPRGLLQCGQRTVNNL